MMKMPAMGLGTFRLKGEPLLATLNTGLALGYRHIDTAQIYDNESEVGEVLATTSVPRSDIYLTTKVWTSEFAEGKLIPSLKTSLEKLRTDYLDLALIHWPSPNDEVPMAVYLEQLAEAKSLGLTREIGVSNFTVAQLKEAIDILGPGSIAHQQVEIHPLLQNRKVVEFCQEQGIAITAYMPLAYGKVLAEPLLMELGKRLGGAGVARLAAGPGHDGDPELHQAGESGRQHGGPQGATQPRRDGRHRHPGARRALRQPGLRTRLGLIPLIPSPSPARGEGGR